jgi:hypothetical protein
MVNTDWISKCDRQIAASAAGILKDVLAEIDLQKPRILISPYPHQWIVQDQDPQVAKDRKAVVKMLVERGVLKSAHYRTEGIVVQADRATVEEARRLLHGRAYLIKTRFGESLPATPSIKEEIKRTHRIERVKLWHTIVGTVLAALVVAALLGGWKWLLGTFGSKRGVMPPTSAESTATDSGFAHSPPRWPLASEGRDRSVSDRLAVLVLPVGPLEPHQVR